MITCLIHTYNSEKYLQYCLESVKWVDEIIVIDMHSVDSSREIAEKYGAKIFLFENLGYADPARQFGLSKATHPWILSIDSDEVVPSALAERLKKVANTDEADVVWLSFRNFFFGRELKGSGWSYRDIRVPRFFKKGFLNYSDKVHEFFEISENVRRMNLCQKDLSILHFNYDSVSHFIQKLDRYTNFEAKKLATAGFLKRSVFYQCTREFDGRFWIKRGFLDGWVGLYLSFAMAFYRFTAIMKFRLPDEKEVIQKYQDIAKRSLNGEKL
jgi:glycosyltransferase involved in cell wall biosynthesis